MYETYFGLKRRPFLAIPDSESYCSVENRDEALAEIERVVHCGDGLSLIFGLAGTGKTLLLRLLRQALETDHTVLLVAGGHLDTPGALFRQLLFDLKWPYSGNDEAELRLNLFDALGRSDISEIVLLIDEAQFLSTSVLEAIRLLVSDEAETCQFRAVLAGTVEFEEILTHPSLETFNQRVVSRTYLEAFSCEETSRYIEWQSRRFGEDFIERHDDEPHDEDVVLALCESSRLEISETSGKQALNPAGLKGDASGKSNAYDIPSWGDVDDDDSAAGLADFIENSGAHSGHQVSAPHVASPHVAFPPAHRPVPFFSEQARERIHRLTGGVPRLINQLCDGSLQLAAERTLPSVDESLVQAAWAKLQHFDTHANTAASTPKADGEEPETPQDCAPKESVEEIVARKKATFRPQEFAHTVQFGTLDSVEGDLETQRFAAELDNDLLFAASEVIPEQMAAEKIIEAAEPVFAADHKPALLAGPQTLLRLSYEVAPVLSSPTLLTEGMEDFPVDAETLEQYESEILENRPPFVRREPDYAYQTTGDIPGFASTANTLPDSPELVYPIPALAHAIKACWAPPEMPEGVGQKTLGFGTAYSAFLSDFLSRSEQELAEELTATSDAIAVQVAVQIAEQVVEQTTTPTPTETAQAAFATERPAATPIFRLVLSAEENSRDTPTALDESFDEIVAVQARAIALDDVFCPQHVSPRSIRIPRTATSLIPPAAARPDSPQPVWDESGFQTKIESALSRITAAAEKIELAAVVSEEAGRHVRRAAEFVETEVQSALPTCVDLFKELSEFQKTVTSELTSMQEMSQISETLRHLQSDDPIIQSLAEHRLAEHNMTPTLHAKLLPFPRHAELRHSGFPPAVPTKVPPTLHESPDGTTPDRATKEDQSIDVRMLFQ